MKPAPSPLCLFLVSQLFIFCCPTFPGQIDVIHTKFSIKAHGTAKTHFENFLHDTYNATQILSSSPHTLPYFVRRTKHLPPHVLPAPRLYFLPSKATSADTDALKVTQDLPPDHLPPYHFPLIQQSTMSISGAQFLSQWYRCLTVICCRSRLHTKTKLYFKVQASAHCCRSIGTSHTVRLHVDTHRGGFVQA